MASYYSHHGAFENTASNEMGAEAFACTEQLQEWPGSILSFAPGLRILEKISLHMTNDSTAAANVSDLRISLSSIN